MSEEAKNKVNKRDVLLYLIGVMGIVITIMFVAPHLQRERTGNVQTKYCFLNVSATEFWTKEPVKDVVVIVTEQLSPTLETTVSGGYTNNDGVLTLNLTYGGDYTLWAVYNKSNLKCWSNPKLLPHFNFKRSGETKYIEILMDYVYSKDTLCVLHVKET